jgi:two-component system, OmpR family, response regulator PhoP
MKVLVVEDTARLREAIVRGLRHHGLVVEAAHDGPAGLWATREMQPDVLVLDLGLPGFGGLELLARLRAEGNTTPALMLTAASELQACLSSFEAGADDYAVKPIDILELVARVRALARRAAGAASSCIVLGDIELDPARAEVRLAGVPLAMRRRERLLLEVLAAQRGRVVRRETLERKLYDDRVDLSSNAIEVAVSQLRRWIDRAGEPSRITTVRGEGYRLDR